MSGIAPMSGLKSGSLDELIEQDIDAFGLQHTLQRIELLCAEKSAHIRTNYGDKQLALKWKLFSIKLQRISQQAGEILP